MLMCAYNTYNIIGCNVLNKIKRHVTSIFYLSTRDHYVIKHFYQFFSVLDNMPFITYPMTYLVFEYLNQFIPNKVMIGLKFTKI